MSRADVGDLAFYGNWQNFHRRKSVRHVTHYHCSHAETDQTTKITRWRNARLQTNTEFPIPGWTWRTTAV